MVPLAECRLRPPPRALSILAALLGAGLLASACSEAPKLAKAPPRIRQRAKRRPVRRRKLPKLINPTRTLAGKQLRQRKPSGFGNSAARKARPSKSIRAATNRSPAQAHPRREQVRSRAYPTPTSPPTMLRERPEVVHPKYRPMSRAQPAKVLRRCNPKCHREARHRRAT